MTAQPKAEPVDAEIVQHEPAYQAPAVVDQQAAMLSMIERVAMNPELPIERLNQLLDMKERIDDRAREERAREAEAAYYEAMAACQAELKSHPVIKNKNNTQTHSKYADLAAISKAIDVVIHRHGFMVSFQPGGKTETGDEIVRYTIAGKGHVERGEAVLPTDDKGPKGEVNKTKLHGFGSTMSYGRRYLKLMLFDVATGDDDDGNKGGGNAETISSEQFNVLFEMMQAADAGDTFLQVYGVDDLRDLPAKMFAPARTILQQRIAKKAAPKTEETSGV